MGEAIPSIAWSVNISGDGRFAVAAFGDGTIRWYRITDGKQLLAFFPHNDHKRWVAWTPSGYYDTSPGAEEMIGWHVNNGRDAAADFFPVAQFRNTYYRPDVIARVLQTGDELRALEMANQEAGRKQQQADIAEQLPPVVEIISPSDDSEVSATEITVRYRIRTPSGEPVTNIKALVDGRPTGTRALSVRTTSEAIREIPVTCPKATARFQSSPKIVIRRAYPLPSASSGAGAALRPTEADRDHAQALCAGRRREPLCQRKFNLRFLKKTRAISSPRCSRRKACSTAK